MFSKATLVKYLHICCLLAVDITHNRERKAPNALIHWTTAMLLLQRRKKGPLQRFSTVNAALSVFFLLRYLFHLFFFDRLIPQFACYLFVRPFAPFMLKNCQSFLQLLSFLLRCSHIVFGGLLSFFHLFPFRFKYSPAESSCLNSSSRSYFPSANSVQLPHSLCSRAQSSDSHLSMSGWLPSPNLFPCQSPRQGRPPVLSFSRREEKLARGSDNPLTLHLSSARGKAPS